MPMEPVKAKSFEETVTTSIPRSKFLKYSGFALASSVILIEACKKDNNNTSGSVNLGSGDTAILNYAYALEQLEAAFYTQVIATPYSGISSAETAILTDFMYHEVIHRNFFKAALGTSAIIDLTPNFSSIDFTSRASVLGAAKAFEDLGVSAYNGAGKLISTSATGTTYLGLAGKIVSVEARHAAAIRDLLLPSNAASGFAGDDVVDANGLDGAKTPSQVLAIAGAYVKNTFTGIPG